MKNPFKLSLGIFLGLLILMGAVRPGPVGGAGGTKITGAASTIATTNLAASRAIISNAQGKIEASSVTSSQLALLGSTSANSIIARPSASPGAPSALTLSANQFPCRGSSGDVTACSVGSGLSFSGATLSATAEGWVSQSQVSNGTTLTLSGLSGTLYEFEIYVISNSASSLMDLTLNGSSGSWSYYQQYQGTGTSGAGSYIMAGAVGSSSISLMTGRAFANGATVAAQLTTAATGLGVSHGLIYKTLAAATITSITITSNQASGIGAGSIIRARKIS